MKKIRAILLISKLKIWYWSIRRKKKRKKMALHKYCIVYFNLSCTSICNQVCCFKIISLGLFIKIIFSNPTLLSDTSTKLFKFTITNAWNLEVFMSCSDSRKSNRISFFLKKSEWYFRKCSQNWYFRPKILGVPLNYDILLFLNYFPSSANNSYFIEVREICSWAVVDRQTPL